MKHSKQELVRPITADLSSVHEGMLDDIKEFAVASEAKNSRRAFQSDIEHFSEWCSINGFSPLPSEPVTVAAYISSLAKGKADNFGVRKVSTIGRRLASIARNHGLGGHPDPTKDTRVRTVWRGIRRTLGVRRTKKAPMLRADVLACVQAIRMTPMGLRDRAILLLGYEAALRRSEICSIRFKDIRNHPKGLVLSIPFSKTNQEGDVDDLLLEESGLGLGVKVLKAWMEWLMRAGVKSGPIFRGLKNGVVSEKALTGNDIARIVKFYAEKIGADPKVFSGHSLRAGYATDQAAMGKSNREIRRVTRHRSDRTVDEYIRDSGVK